MRSIKLACSIDELNKKLGYVRFWLSTDAKIGRNLREGTVTWEEADKSDLKLFCIKCLQTFQT